MSENINKLIDGLNEDLAHEYGAVVQYTYSAAVVSGLERVSLKPFFESEINDELGHALYLSEKIKSLGGIPTTKVTENPQPTKVKDLLEAALKAEKDTIERYKTRLKQAENLGYTELAVTLEDMIADETRHKEEIEHLLED
ncbi:MAG TPA: ferritin-like domain-containing protein [Candidatus Avamphibacillus sp.]|nr:ferritin-like domain-containing protein [Candidatus Avamphibacillus sp.]